MMIVNEIFTASTLMSGNDSRMTIDSIVYIVRVRSHHDLSL